MSLDLMKVVSALTIEIPLIVSILSPFELDNGHQYRIDTMKISKISFDEQPTFFFDKPSLI